MSTSRGAAAGVLGAAAVAASVAASVARRHHTLSAVAPELRTPALWLPLPVTGRLSLTLARRLSRRTTHPVAGVAVTRHDVPGGRDAFVYESPGRRRPGGALLWIHGGGTILGHPESDHELCSRIARDLRIVVVSARYRLAPEHPFPDGFDDCFAALRWLHDAAPALGVDGARVAVGGASAGGGLAASVVQKAHDHGLPVAFQMLLYPMLDDRTALVRDHRGRGRIGWTPRSNTYAWTCYLGRGSRVAEPLVYAAAGRREDLRGLPPAWIGVGDLDLFYSENLRYAERLRAAGVPVDLVVEPGMYHGADFDHHATVPSMRAFRQGMLDALAAGLTLGPATGRS
ncbi:alpha/beta hydrolase [Microbispora sp. NEAU-D428]|uniref:alpha/beta hydrolase n=1 Tax=Microbispora sitophila TaxID=2771537 RepID=UPI001868234C|nr:alpha/beta hydrolase [Microbispora sitophila]MBE3012414.1 alpha/beta hydrolase [Microbispora sitophila]